MQQYHTEDQGASTMSIWTFLPLSLNPSSLTKATHKWPCPTQSSSAHTKAPWVFSFRLQKNVGKEHFLHLRIFRPHMVLACWCGHIWSPWCCSLRSGTPESAKRTVKMVVGGPVREAEMYFNDHSSRRKGPHSSGSPPSLLNRLAFYLSSERGSSTAAPILYWLQFCQSSKVQVGNDS